MIIKLNENNNKELVLKESDVKNYSINGSEVMEDDEYDSCVLEIKKTSDKINGFIDAGLYNGAKRSAEHLVRLIDELHDIRKRLGIYW